MEIEQVTGLHELATVYVARVRGAGGPLLEFVDGLDPRHERGEKWVVNISTQFGCPVGCLFCDAGGDFRGNCTAEEMLDQIRFVLDRHSALAESCRKLKVHFARMGEPALNDAVLETIARLPAVAPTPGLWCCVATVAPAGRRSWFDRLADLQHHQFPRRFQLQFSVNSTDEATRRRLMPIALEDLDWIAAHGVLHYLAGGRKPALNFALAQDVPFDPRAIIARFDPRVFAVKLTPLNPTAEAGRHGLQTILRSAQADALDDAVAALQAAGFEVLLSVGDAREDRIGSNCGQAVRARRAVIVDNLGLAT